MLAVSDAWTWVNLNLINLASRQLREWVNLAVTCDNLINNCQPSGNLINKVT